MEVEMEMEMEMEDDTSSGNTSVAFTFTAVEIDIDYEFEAARFFDFTREESTDEANEAENWFDSAQSYPPSPFAARLLSREQGGNANGHTVLNDSNNAPQASSMALSDTAVNSVTDGDVGNEGAPLDFKNYLLQAFQKQQSTSTILKESKINGNDKSKTKSGWKPSFPRTSTLMKPTASQLAKQNKERLMDNFRFQKLGNNSSAVDSQAAKRQKLEGGHLCKGTDSNHQENFVHKAPKREGNEDGNLGRGRLRLTVPRPPDLATAQRAQRIRQKDNSGNEHVTSRAPGFRARPLNRKIFETPSLLQQKRRIPQLPEFQEFHLKTSERALQNAKAPQKPSFAFGIDSGSRESKGPQATGAQKQEECEPIHRFKALPLNKKVLSSKFDIGVFRSSKRESTVATGFHFQTEMRAHHTPPVDLFSKLSLASEAKLSTRPPSIFSKGSKENRVQDLDRNQLALTAEK